MIAVLPVEGIPEVKAGDDLATLLSEAAGSPLQDGDVLVVTQKVVSKAEGRFAPAADKPEVVASESSRVLRRMGTTVIAETRHGFVCANAGVDESNVPMGQVAMLPLDPDSSARKLRAKLQNLTGVELAVIVSDTFGRAWRIGQTDVAIGVAGMDPFVDYIGTEDAEGRTLHATRICIADQIAGAAEMVMGKAQGICAAIVRGSGATFGRGSAASIVRPPDQDLFR